MALHIENPEAERLARELAEATGEPVDEAVLAAMRQRLARTRESDEEFLKRIHELQRRVAALPTFDNRSADEILYDADGLPH